MQNKNVNTQGFTLVELLVVVTIISILSVGGFSIFTSAQQKARDAVRITDTRALITTVEQMNLDRVGGGTSCGAGNGYPETNDAADFHDKIIDFGYLDIVPEDPQNAGENVYRYAATPACAGYEISTRFEHVANTPRGVNDPGDDPDRYELGTPNCIGTNEANCVETGEQLDTSSGTTDIEYP